MGREEAKLVAATATLLRTVPADQRAAMLRYLEANFRSTLMEIRAGLSSAEIAARVREHTDAIKAQLRGAG